MNFKVKKIESFRKNFSRTFQVPHLENNEIKKQTKLKEGTVPKCRFHWPKITSSCLKEFTQNSQKQTVCQTENGFSSQQKGSRKSPCWRDEIENQRAFKQLFSCFVCFNESKTYDFPESSAKKTSKQTWLSLFFSRSSFLHLARFF